jgi:pyruvate/2-oxoglutarate/acetoin dehydrogenase E1 component
MEKEDFQKQLDEQQKALAMIYKSVEKTRKMILWSGIVTAVTFIIPLIIAVAMLPKMIDTLTGDINKINGNEPIQLNAESLSDTLNNLKDLGL